MNKNRKIIIGAVLALLLGITIWTVESLPEVPDASDVLQKRVMTYSGNTISDEKNGKKIWEVSAETMEVDIDTQDAALTNMVARFYTEDGKTIEVKAPRATYTAKKKYLECLDGITGSGSDGEKIKCDKIEWQADNSRLALVGNAELEREKDQLKAKGDKIESTDNFNRFKIEGHAHLEKGNK